MSDPDDRPAPRAHAEPFSDLAARRYSRRAALALGVGLAALPVAGAVLLDRRAVRGRQHAAGFEPVAWERGDEIVVPPGYVSEVVVRWGDPLLPGAPEHRPAARSAQDQAAQLGYNCDFVAFFPLPEGAQTFDRGLLCISSEYTDPRMMWADYRNTREQVDADLAAHGLNVVAVERGADGVWRYLPGHRLNRRVTAASPIAIAGPARGHARMRTAADPAGETVLGTINNCAGGVTPWGTWLQAEENFHNYFVGGHPDPWLAADDARSGITGEGHYWAAHHERFVRRREPNEPHRFGWIVETDPYDPEALPRKRTALGRFAHEAATPQLTGDGRVAVYMGDDRVFEYVYKFVSDGRYDPEDRAANRDLLDRGTLSVARFEDDGTGRWLPLVHGEGPLTAANGFADQAEVLIACRRAADLLGATPMDRPEDIAVSPVTGSVYVACTNNTARRPDQVDGPNPRAGNRYGHIVEIVEDGDDAAATSFRWQLPLIAGPPDEGRYGEVPADGALSPLSCPDNLAFDRAGNLWIATDGQEWSVGANDGVYRMPVSGPERGVPRQFLSGVRGCEICGPCFTPDETTFFCAVQHPGDGRGATWAEPVNRWPDQRPGEPPRPSVIAVRRADGGPVGS